MYLRSLLRSVLDANGSITQIKEPKENREWHHQKLIFNEHILSQTLGNQTKVLILYTNGSSISSFRCYSLAHKKLWCDENSLPWLYLTVRWSSHISVWEKKLLDLSRQLKIFKEKKHKLIKGRKIVNSYFVMETWKNNFFALIFSFYIKVHGFWKKYVFFMYGMYLFSVI